jgi:hypothetical protein
MNLGRITNLSRNSVHSQLKMPTSLLDLLKERYLNRARLEKYKVRRIINKNYNNQEIKMSITQRY